MITVVRCTCWDLRTEFCMSNNDTCSVVTIAALSTQSRPKHRCEMPGVNCLVPCLVHRCVCTDCLTPKKGLNRCSFKLFAVGNAQHGALLHGEHSVGV